MFGFSEGKRKALGVDSPAVVVRSVSKSYIVDKSNSLDASQYKGNWNSQLVPALKDINLVVEKGESVGIIGRNGSGKSTLLRLISGGELPTQGEILVSARPTLLGVAPALQNHLTGEQNIFLGCMAIGLSKAEAKSRISEIAEWADIGGAISRPMSTYSAGQNARLSFAISTAVSPEILIVDEALSTGDAAFVAKARKRMQELLEQAGNLFLVSHSIKEIRKNCARTIWIHEGEVIADGDTDLVCGSYQKWIDLESSGNRAASIEQMKKIRRFYPQTTIELTSDANWRC